MALFLIFFLLAGLFEPTKRPDPASNQKIVAEGGLKELIIFLGWLIDTRRFIVTLPTEKWKVWSTNIKALVSKRSVTY